MSIESSYDSYIKEHFIFKAECLFNTHVADYLEKHINYKAVYKSKAEIRIFRLVKEDEYYHPDYSSFYLNKEFNDQFKKYLKLK